MELIFCSLALSLVSVTLAVCLLVVTVMRPQRDAKLIERTLIVYEQGIRLGREGALMQSVGDKLAAADQECQDEGPPIRGPGRRADEPVTFAQLGGMAGGLP